MAADLTPLGTNALGAFAAALPTTHLSLHAPEFNMQQPPSTTRTAIPNKSLATPAPSSSSAPSAAAASQTSSSKGQIHVKLIQARGLNVRMMHARPYVVVQFEQNEFVSRDPTNETDKEVKGTATNLSRNGSSNALSVLGAIGSKAAALDASRRGKSSANSSPASSVSSGKSSIGSTVAVGGFSNGLFGRLSAHNPVWKHEVSL